MSPAYDRPSTRSTPGGSSDGRGVTPGGFILPLRQSGGGRSVSPLANRNHNLAGAGAAGRNGSYYLFNRSAEGRHFQGGGPAASHNGRAVPAGRGANDPLIGRGHPTPGIFQRGRPSPLTGGNRGPLGRAAQLNPGRAESLTPIRGYHPSAYHLFTRSFEGRRFNNGIYLRPAERIHNTVFINYFAGGRSFYPYYCPTFSFGSAYYSPYYYYGGVCPPYIYSRFCLFLPPAVVYVETPVYVNNECLGYPSGGYYLQQYRDEVLARRDPGFERAVNDIREAFLERNIQPLVDITDPNIDIAVFAKGHYQYSMKSDDYLDITRDAFQNMTTISLNLDRVSRRAIGVYVVSGKQVYEDQNNQVHKVYVSFVLEHLNGQWVLTQVASSPG